MELFLLTKLQMHIFVKLCWENWCSCLMVFWLHHLHGLPTLYKNSKMK